MEMLYKFLCVAEDGNALYILLDANLGLLAAFANFVICDLLPFLFLLFRYCPIFIPCFLLDGVWLDVFFQHLMHFSLTGGNLFNFQRTTRCCNRWNRLGRPVFRVTYPQDSIKPFTQSPWVPGTSSFARWRRCRRGATFQHVTPQISSFVWRQSPKTSIQQCVPVNIPWRRTRGLLLRYLWLRLCSRGFWILWRRLLPCRGGMRTCITRCG
mmetsp:Transcript_29489/g.55274  ORF Transcript_29489/g.55274 Transcript_29489/m.55274 type:complete len:211 (-) Transcript_29489:449-1081(-)